MHDPGKMDYAKIDVHQHFWKYSQSDYPWISDDMAVIRKDFLPEDLLNAFSGTGYSASIAVQARQSKEETEWLLALAKQNPEILGVVGWLDLCASDIEKQIGRYAAEKKLKGLRHVLQDEPDDAFMLKPEFLNGLSCMESAGLLYEILIFPRHLNNAVRLAGLFPSQKFVLDHCAKPPVRKAEILEWAQGIKKLASFPNVSCKVSGLVTEADWVSWQPEDFYPYLDIIWNAFGADRIMLGTDWPVCLVAATYEQVVGVAEGYFEQYGEELIRRVTSANAVREYCL